jgi:hypothetical protein
MSVRDSFLHQLSEVDLSGDGVAIDGGPPLGRGGARRERSVPAQVPRATGGAGPPQWSPPAADPGGGRLQPVVRVRVSLPGRRRDPHLPEHREAGVV